MYKQERTEQIQFDILALVEVTGVATQKQLTSAEVAHRNSVVQHLEKLEAEGYLERQEAQGYYYGRWGRPSPVYRLTSAGATYLHQINYPQARATGLRDKTAIGHALAMLDCRLVLLNQKERGRTVVTDKPLAFSKDRTIRPDNRLEYRDQPWIFVESEGVGTPVTNSRKRVFLKASNLLDFFRSERSRNVDPAIRIVYLWGPKAHEKALYLWTEACYTLRYRNNLERLPFTVHFIPHTQFLESGTLDLAQYEDLPLGGTEPRPEARMVYAKEQSTCLDDDLFAFVKAFQSLYRGGVERMTQVESLLELTRSFIMEHALLRSRLEWLLPLNATNHAAMQYGLERLGVSFFRGLNIPAQYSDFLTDQNGRTAVLVETHTDGRNRPGLKVKIHPVLGRDLLAKWSGEPKKLEELLMEIVGFIASYGEELDIQKPKKQRAEKLA